MSCRRQEAQIGLAYGVLGQEHFGGHSAVIFDSCDWFTPEMLQAEGYFWRKRLVLIETFILLVDAVAVVLPRRWTGQSGG